VGAYFARQVRGVSLRITVPPGTSARLEIPPAWHPKGVVRLNGRSVAISALTALRDGVHSIELR
jgi:hypothetical protein